MAERALKRRREELALRDRELDLQARELELRREAIAITQAEVTSILEKAKAQAEARLILTPGGPQEANGLEGPSGGPLVPKARRLDSAQASQHLQALESEEQVAAFVADRLRSYVLQESLPSSSSLVDAAYVAWAKERGYDPLTLKEARVALTGVLRYVPGYTVARCGARSRRSSTGAYCDADRRALTLCHRPAP